MLVMLAMGVSACRVPAGSGSERLRPGNATPVVGGASAEWYTVEVDRDQDGRFETLLHLNQARLLRIDVDQDQDGRIDRWEHYDAASRMVRVGSSSRDDQVEDTWTYPDEGGFLSRVESDRDRDGRVDNREIFLPGPGADGRVLSIVEIDFNSSGTPGRRLYYRPDGTFERVEVRR
jgi:hypothetical protein